jgi:hypothetical protein
MKHCAPAIRNSGGEIAIDGGYIAAGAANLIFAPLERRREGLTAGPNLLGFPNNKRGDRRPSRLYRHFPERALRRRPTKRQENAASESRDDSSREQALTAGGHSGLWLI